VDQAKANLRAAEERAQAELEAAAQAAAERAAAADRTAAEQAAADLARAQRDAALAREAAERAAAERTAALAHEAAQREAAQREEALRDAAQRRAAELEAAAAAAETAEREAAERDAAEAAAQQAAQKAAEEAREAEDVEVPAEEVEAAQAPVKPHKGKRRGSGSEPDKAAPEGMLDAFFGPPAEAPAEPEPIRTVHAAPAAKTSQKKPAAQPAAASPDLVMDRVREKLDMPAGVVEFKRRGASQSMTAMLQLVLLALALGAVYLAYQEPTTVTVGLAAALSVALLVLAFRSSSAPAQLKIENGTLDIVASQSHYRFDLGNPKVRLEMPDPPESRKWKVLVHRTGMAPYVIDSSMVAPAEFTKALRRYRPEL
jgi:hypothetical protein